MESFQFLADLTVALAAAAVAGFIATRIGLNPIVGYLLAGIVIGPFTPGYVTNSQTLNDLSELGLIFLLFSLGLGFSFQEVLSIGWKPIGMSLIVMGMFVVGLGLAFPWFGIEHPWTLAVVAAVSSTAIGAALLGEWKITETRGGKFVLALLIVQDLAAVTLLVLAETPTQNLSIVGILMPMAKAVGFVIVALVFGSTVLQYFVKRLLRTVSTEALFPTFAAFALVASWIAQFAGLSFDFGAFVAGAVISEAAGSRIVQSIIAPFRALFIALFFVSIGTLIDPKIVAQYWVLILTIGAAFVVMRFLGWTAVARFGGFSTGIAAALGLSMVALGEFNIVLADAATQAHRIENSERSIVLGIILFSILASAICAPLVRRFVPALER